MDSSTAPCSKSSCPTCPSALAPARVPAPLHSAHNETGASAPRVPPHVHVRVLALRASSAGRGNSIVVLVILTEGHCHRVGFRNGTCIVHDPARVLAHRFAAAPLWVRGGDLQATSAVDMVAGIVQDHSPLCARAAPGQGHPLGPCPALGLGLSVAHVHVHVLAPALVPVLCHTLRIPEAVVGLGRTAGAVEAIAVMTSGTADLAPHTQKTCDDRTARLTVAAFRHISLKFARYTVVVYA